MKTYFEELEFGGLGNLYIEVLGCLRHPLATTPQLFLIILLKGSFLNKFIPNYIIYFRFFINFN
jgi:hypothetical protein